MTEAESLQHAVSNPKSMAHAAGLRYVSDSMPGISRRRCGRGFLYLDPAGRRVAAESTLEHINSLAIPPAYREVWICPFANGHLQATGYDDAQRKQYRYHPVWQSRRARHKYEGLIEFAERLPCLRRQVARDLKRRKLTFVTVVACVVRLLDETLIRVGNWKYAEINGSRGLTTLQDRHVRFETDALRFCFTGKSGQRHKISMQERRLFGIIRRCHDLPGQHLFQYESPDGTPARLSSADVNEYLADVMGEGVSAKDFRTWGGTVLAAITLAREERAAEAEQRAQRIGGAVKAVAARLGNRPATCQKYYIHPAVIGAFEAGTLADAMNRSPRSRRPVPWTTLSAEEQAVLDLLRSG